MPKPSIVGSRLKELREQRKLSIADLARASGVDRNAISMVEGGSSNSPSFQNGVRLARALGVDPAFLAGVESEGATLQASDRLDQLQQQIESLRQIVEGLQGARDA